jgi:hypothetical protein
LLKCLRQLADAGILPLVVSNPEQGEDDKSAMTGQPW